MPIDTAAKRASTLSLWLPWGTLPAPDGAITSPDRQHTAYDYIGIAAASVTVVSGFVLSGEAVRLPQFAGERLHSPAFSGEAVRIPEATNE